MSRAVLAAAIALAFPLNAQAKPPPKKGTGHGPPPLPPAWTRPAPPLPMLPRVGRVRVEAARDRVVVVEDVVLPRGDWESGGLDLYVAFGAPGTPIAIDARLVTPPAGGLDAHPEEAGDQVVLEPSPHRNAGAQLLLGKPQMAGVVAHVKETQLRRVYAAGEVAVLRLRSLLVAPAADATGARDVVVRLGVPGGLPITLGRIQVASLEPQPWIARAEAALCGPEASPLPLSVSLSGKAPGKAADATAPPPATIAPEFALRHASDDLCIRWWGRPAP
jgi:hypothetical protein